MPQALSMPLTMRLAGSLLSLAIGCGVMAPSAVRAAAIKPPSTNVAWVAAANDADVGRAFARARAENKPLLMYWGATWCPPCNQLKATLFNRQDFAAQSRAFVPVHVDGDRPGAQQLGRRFGVSGYPTVVLFNAEGAELTRLPGEVDAEQMMSVLQLGLAGGRPIHSVLADARAGKPLSANEWRLLAFYSWETDDAKLVPKAELPSVLAQLASASPAGDSETATRLWLKALAASDDGKGLKADAALKERVQRVLADPAQARVHMDVITGEARDLVRNLSADDSADRQTLVTQYESALKRLVADTSLSRADRLGAVIARVHLARLHLPKNAVQVQLPEPLLADVREHVARQDREITDGYERQAVITAAAYTLGLAGLWRESDELLRANLAKSHSPYYLMSQLAGNARKLGKAEEALDWYRQSFEKSVGPATRLQWGAGYVDALVELAPKDSARIEKTVSQLLREAARDSSSLDGRSLRSLQRMSGKVVSWSDKSSQTAALKRLQAQLAPICAKAPAADGRKAACNALLKPAAAKA